MCMQYSGRQNDGDFKRITRVESFYIITNSNAVEIGIKNRIIEFIQQKKEVRFLVSLLFYITISCISRYLGIHECTQGYHRKSTK